jgi:hypothetical protein
VAEPIHEQEPSYVCEGCRGMGGNWNCEGENDLEHCNCLNCTGSDACPECGE